MRIIGIPHVSYQETTVLNWIAYLMVMTVPLLFIFLWLMYKNQHSTQLSWIKWNSKLCSETWYAANLTECNFGKHFIS